MFSSGEVFVIYLLIAMWICFYISQEPHCKKHKLTRMNKKIERQIESDIMAMKSVVIHHEIVYECPKCHSELSIIKETPNPRV